MKETTKRCVACGNPIRDAAWWLDFAAFEAADEKFDGGEFSRSRHSEPDACICDMDAE
jgi:hypothetical protein